MDTSVETKENPFWEKLLEVFDEYFDAADSVRFDDKKIRDDIRKIEKLIEYSPLPIADCYASIATKTIRSQRKKNVVSRVLSRLNPR